VDQNIRTPVERAQPDGRVVVEVPAKNLTVPLE